MTISPDATNTADRDFAGFHRFDKDGGSFEVWRNEVPELAGWYWWRCKPGSLPAGRPFGPYPTAEGAYLAAIGDDRAGPLGSPYGIDQAATHRT